MTLSEIRAQAIEPALLLLPARMESAEAERGLAIAEITV